MDLPDGRYRWAAFIVASVTLQAQILLHRMVSVKLLSNYAFLVISLTMLGFAISGVLLTRFRSILASHLHESLVTLSALLALSLVLASVLLYRVDPGIYAPSSRAAFVTQLITLMPLALLLAVPFVFAGLALGLLLSHPQLRTGRIYGADLAGSAVGAFLAVPLITWLGAERALVAAAAGALLGLVVLWRPGTRLGRSVVAAALLVLAVAAIAPARVFHLRFGKGSMLEPTERSETGWTIEDVKWDPIARIEVTHLPPLRPESFAYPCLLGGNRQLHERVRRMLSQNGYAFTFALDYDGSQTALDGIEETIYAAAYEARGTGPDRVLVIGVGGGFDVLTALRYDARSIVGVEINAATLTILERSALAPYFRHWVDDPRVKLVQGEGRQYLKMSTDLYDVIQLSGVDSYSGTPAAAHIFSENYLYTREAFDLYLSHLTQDGILNMMRLEYPYPQEMLRAAVMAVESLRRAGVAQPTAHIVMVTSRQRNFSALLVKKTPFTTNEQDRLESWAGKSPFFDISASPRLKPQHQNVYQTFLSLGEPRLERAFVRTYELDISATDDNRPFFFHHSRWRHLWSQARAARANIPFMEISTLILVGAIGLVACATVLLPLRFLAAHGMRQPGVARLISYFAAMGLGYLAIEIALLQKLSLFLGHPNYALSVVLAALLLSTGVGALASGRILAVLGNIRFVAYTLCALVIAETLLLLPHLPQLVGWPFPMKIVLVLLALAPLGAMMGVFFPTGMEHIKKRNPDFAPWAWGVNGVFSVLAPVLSVAFSMSWGIDALLLAGVPIYLFAGAVLPECVAGQPPAPE